MLKPCLHVVIRFYPHKKVRTAVVLFAAFVLQIGCRPNLTDGDKASAVVSQVADTMEIIQEEVQKVLTADDIRFEKDIQFKKYVLEDEYPYKDTTRVFQWKKMKECIAFIENAVADGGFWGVLSNYKNLNGEAPTIEDFVRNEYQRVTDKHGVERYQSSPLYSAAGDTTLTRYGRDGWLVKLLDSDTLAMIKVNGVSVEGEFLVPKRYIQSWGDTVRFDRVVVVDVTNQNIATLEKRDSLWAVLSMNHATTGRRKPPYAQETPRGIFAVQQKKAKMLYEKDGSSEIAGFAPYASRFTNGAYVHGVPTENPKGSIIEYSMSLGTTPRSHMCVRNASSHAKFVF
ncbi:MAG: L,D-transpeptidase, partial [Dysgonamonadaceae bacterium]|nr:L,D-transpeptidase [Dysgonamonadaceae bacterium]